MNIRILVTTAALAGGLVAGGPAQAWPTYDDFVTVQATYTAVEGEFENNGVRMKSIYLPDVEPEDLEFDVIPENGKTHIRVTAIVVVTPAYRLRSGLASTTVECRMGARGGDGYWTERYLEAGSAMEACQFMVQVLIPD